MSSPTSSSDCPECVTLITVVKTTTLTPSPVLTSKTIQTITTQKSSSSSITSLITESSSITSLPTSPAIITSSSSPTQSSNTTTSGTSGDNGDDPKITGISLGVAVPAFILLLLAIFFWRRQKAKVSEGAEERSRQIIVQDVNQMPMVSSQDGRPIIPPAYLNGRHYTTNEHGGELLAVPYPTLYATQEQRTPDSECQATTSGSTFTAFLQAAANNPGTRDVKTPPSRPGRPEGMASLTNHEIAAVSSLDPLGYAHLAYARKHSSPAHELATREVTTPVPRFQRRETIREQGIEGEEVESDEQHLERRLTQYSTSPSYSHPSNTSSDRIAHQRNITPEPGYSPPTLRIIKQQNVHQNQDNAAVPPIPEKSIFRNGTYPTYNRTAARFGPALASSDPLPEKEGGYGGFEEEIRRRGATMSPVPTEQERRLQHEITLAYLEGKSPARNVYRSSSIYSRDEQGTPTPVYGELMEGGNGRIDGRKDDEVERKKVVARTDWV